MNEAFCPSLRFKGLRRQRAKVLAFFVHDPSRTLWLGSILLLSPFVSAACFRTICIRLLWECLYKKNQKASCVFIALAITCRAKRITSVSSSKKLRNVFSRRPNSRRLTQEPLDGAWLPLHAFSSRRLLPVRIGSNEEYSDDVFKVLPPPVLGLTLCDWFAGLLYSLVGEASETQKSSVASQGHQLLGSRAGTQVFQCGTPALYCSRPVILGFRLKGSAF